MPDGPLAPRIAVVSGCVGRALWHVDVMTTGLGGNTAMESDEAQRGQCLYPEIQLTRIFKPISADFLVETKKLGRSTPGNQILFPGGPEIHLRSEALLRIVLCLIDNLCTKPTVSVHLCVAYF